jgi:hypothetical protein
LSKITAPDQNPAGSDAAEPLVTQRLPQPASGASETPVTGRGLSLHLPPLRVLATWVTLSGLAIMLGVGLSWAPRVFDSERHPAPAAPTVSAERQPAGMTQAGGAAGPSQIVVIDSGAIAAHVLGMAMSGKDAQQLAPHAAELGRLVGQIVQAAANQYAKAGVLVLGGGVGVLAVPPGLDKTAEVLKIVDAQIRRRYLSAPASFPAEAP